VRGKAYNCTGLILQELREQLRLPSRDAAAAAQAARAALPGPMPLPAQPTHRQAAAGAARPAAGQAEQTGHLTVDAAARLPEGARAAVAGLLTSDPRRVAVQHSASPHGNPCTSSQTGKTLHYSNMQWLLPCSILPNSALRAEGRVTPLQGAGGNGGLLLASLRGGGGGHVKLACFDRDGSAQR
jgi:hypothetical protein